MKALKEFAIQFVGLKEGKHLFEYKINKSFFDFFEYEEFNDSNVNVRILLNKKETLLELNFNASGYLNVNCDLTNESFDQTISNQFDLVVKFGDEFNNENEEILILPRGEYELNVAQYIYELVVLSVPSKRIHPGVKDGTLDSDILKKLEELSPKGFNRDIENDEIDPRWNTLKKLLTDK
jgi:uncharacterized metal-binding protein YceD (DUF177 family)